MNGPITNLNEYQMKKTRWQHEEREACSLFNAEHIGGAGRPDCIGTDYVVEVKHHRGRVHMGIVRNTIMKEWSEGVQLKIVSTSGFTEGAIAHAENEGVELFQKRGKTLIPVTSNGFDADDDEEEDLVEDDDLDEQDLEDDVGSDNTFLGVMGAIATAGLAFAGVVALGKVLASSRQG